MNRLADETSPYLLQHAANPVHWHPWDEAALAEARAQDKPILLSVGYSACHWCHVMAHESFEDEATAEAMNAHFVNVKVDREERPDLDRVYQTAFNLLSRQTGGWPLTMFLDPHTLLPFFGGTYFPKRARFNLPGFTDLLLRVADGWNSQRTELTEQGEKLSEALSALRPTEAEVTGVEDQDLLQKAVDQLASQFDHAEGGFGSAPKFPMPSTLERVLRHWALGARAGAPDRGTLEMVTTTLTKIARGGIYDHVGGGFCRYATDRQWAIPHFEKMLYDNGPLLGLYADALGLGPDLLFEGAVRETAAWIMRDMQHPEGGYFSSLDADSEGEEGKYYVWRRPDVKRLLTEDEYLVVETLYGLDKPANFEGKWNLRRRDAWRAVVQRLSLEPGTADELLDSARAKLLAERGKRTPPDKDTKVLTSWNGLAIRGMAKASVRLGEPAWLVSAQRAADFLRERLWDGERLMATWRDGRAKYAGYLDDYANLLDGVLALLQASWRGEDARFAQALADALLAHFHDGEAGAFFLTAHDHEELIHRPMPTMDEALPPGNGTAARALVALGHLFGETRYLDAAHGTLEALRGSIEKYPAGHCTLLNVVEANVQPPEQVVVRGPRDALDPWLEIARESYRPWRSVYGIPYGEEGVLPGYLPRLVSAETRERVTAFVCTGLACSAPINSIEAFEQAVG